MSVEWRYSNIKCEVLGILHGLEKFHHYCFGREVLIITDHKTIGSYGSGHIGSGHTVTVYTAHTAKNSSV